MIKALLISDTHGHIDIINSLVEKTNVDIVIHAGDFGFYNESSYKHINTRELLLLVSHSKYRHMIVNTKPNRETLLSIVKQHNLLGDFKDYQDNQKQFHVPVYAVYGNHEDDWVIREVKANNTIHNFNLLDEDNVYRITKNNETAFTPDFSVRTTNYSI